VGNPSAISGPTSDGQGPFFVTIENPSAIFGPQAMDFQSSQHCKGKSIGYFRPN